KGRPFHAVDPVIERALLRTHRVTSHLSLAQQLHAHQATLARIRDDDMPTVHRHIALKVSIGGQVGIWLLCPRTHLRQLQSNQVSVHTSEDPVRRLECGLSFLRLDTGAKSENRHLWQHRLYESRGHLYFRYT